MSFSKHSPERKGILWLRQEDKSDAIKMKARGMESIVKDFIREKHSRYGLKEGNGIRQCQAVESCEDSVVAMLGQVQCWGRVISNVSQAQGLVLA